MKLTINILVIFLFFSCNNLNVDKGPHCIELAKDINRSKQLGLFIKEFKPQSITINDSLHFEIVSAWTEYNFYTDDIDLKIQMDNKWIEGKDWILIKEFNPINMGHLSFLVKGDFKKAFPTYNDGWNLNYYHLIETGDTSISNNYTYFESYGPESYDSSTNEIELNFEYYVASKDTNKFGTWFKFGQFKMMKK